MPKDNEVDEKVKPVAWIVTNGGESCEPWLEYEQSEVDALPAVCIAEPLYSAATVAELRAEVERLRVQLAGCGVIAHSNTHKALDGQMPSPGAYGWSLSLADVHAAVLREIQERERADAAERRVAELEAGLASARRAIGDHHAPNDCYATGPLTGDEFLDLVQCPACAFLDQYATLTKVTP